jgi:hypothetical protein
MMDQIAGLVARGLISPDAAQGLVDKASYLKGNLPGMPQITGPEMAPRGGARNYMGSSGKKITAPDYSNQNQTYSEFSYNQKVDQRQKALSKLIENKDFTPDISDGKMKFKSLNKSENQTVNGIGFGRAPNTSYEEEQSSPSTAWEKNIRYWHKLSLPADEFYATMAPEE